MGENYLDEFINRTPKNDNTEITLEVNPADVTVAKAERWKESGINRISIGMQSMINAELAFLGRRHNADNCYQSMNILQKTGFNNISFDLIYGLPDQKPEEVEFSLREYLDLSPTHISTYCLSLADDCLLAGYRELLPQEDIVSDMYYLIRDILSTNNWYHYELSSFCRNDKVSKHNMAYWRQKEYLGCGPSAAGYVSGFRYQNTAFNQWKENIDNGNYFSEKEIIDQDLKEKEYIILALRTREGIQLSDFKDKFNDDFIEKYGELLVKYQNLKLVEYKGGYFRLMPEGYFISNEILREFV